VRRGGWGAAIALAVVAMQFSVVRSGLLIAVPLALLLVALPAARSPYRIIGVVLLALLFATPASDTLWYAERGWALMLGAAFLAVVALRPAVGFVSRGLAAVALAAASGAVVLLFSGDWRSVEFAIARRFRQEAAVWSALLDRADPSLSDVGQTMQRVADVEVMLYPAMLGLASLAALGVAWWVYRRLTEQRGDALAPMREFRFADHLVWVLIAGTLMLVMPFGDVATRTGANLAAFMAALYALRGAAVVVALTGASGLMVFVACVVTVLLLPLLGPPALMIGLSDTWLDLRSRGSGDAASS
jgi:hypothetical protein